MRVKPIGVVILYFCLSITAFYPGFMSPDSLNQYSQAITGDYSDWHPPLMAAIWHLLSGVTPGPLPFLIFNQLILMLAVWLIYARFQNQKASWLILSFPFFPWIINLSGVIWKDVSLAYTLLLIVAIGLQQKKTKLLWAISLIAMFYAVNLRHNSWFALVPVILWMASSLKFKAEKQKIKIAIASLSICLPLAVASLALNNLVLRPAQTYPASYIMIDDLAAVSIAQNESHLPSASLGEIKGCRNSETVYFAAMCLSRGPIPQPLTQLEFQEISEKWKNAILDHPVDYLKFRIVASFEFLGLQDFEPYYIWHPGVDENTLGIVAANNVVTQSLEKYVIVSSKILPFVFMPYFWILLGLGLIWKSLRKKETKLKRLEGVFHKPVAMITLSGLLYSASYFLLAPARDYRYIYWTVAAITLSLILHIIQIQNKKTIPEME